MFLFPNRWEEIYLRFHWDSLDVKPWKSWKRLIFHEAAAVVAKDAGVFILLVYALGQLKCVSLPWYMKTTCNKFININNTGIIYDNFWSERDILFFPSYMLLPVVRPCHTSLILEKSMFSKKFIKTPIVSV